MPCVWHTCQVGIAKRGYRYPSRFALSTRASGSRWHVRCIISGSRRHTPCCTRGRCRPHPPWPSFGGSNGLSLPSHFDPLYLVGSCKVIPERSKRERERSEAPNPTHLKVTPPGHPLAPLVLPKMCVSLRGTRSHITCGGDHPQTARQWVGAPGGGSEQWDGQATLTHETAPYPPPPHTLRHHHPPTHTAMHCPGPRLHKTHPRGRQTDAPTGKPTPLLAPPPPPAQSPRSDPTQSAIQMAWH